MQAGCLRMAAARDAGHGGAAAAPRRGRRARPLPCDGRKRRRFECLGERLVSPAPWVLEEEAQAPRAAGAPVRRA